MAKRGWRRAGRFLVGGLVVALALAMTALSVGIFWFHLGVRPILTSSMRPTYGPGWAVITERIPLHDVKVGMIVLFVPPNQAVAFAHRVTSVTGSPDAPVITTKGDANPSADPWHARLTGTTTSKVIGEVPMAGSILIWLRRQFIPVIVIALFGLAVAVGGARAILRPPSGPTSSPSPS